MGLVSKRGRGKRGVERNEGWVSKLLLMDYSNVLHKGLSVHQELTFKGTYTGGLFGLTQQLASLVREHRPEHVILCDDHGPYLRKTEVFPEYKEDRKKRKSTIPDEAFQHTRHLGERFCEVAGLHRWSAEGWEADDLFALAVKKYHRHYDRIIIASADDDLYQLLKYDNVFLVKKSGLYGAQHYAQEFPDIPPEDWVIFNAIKGGHNNYKGLAGIGPKKALDIMRDEDRLDAVYAEHRDVIETGLKVCCLPLPRETLPEGVDYPEVPEPFAPQFDELEIRSFLQQYGVRPTTALNQSLTHLSGF